MIYTPEHDEALFYIFDFLRKGFKSIENSSNFKEFCYVVVPGILKTSSVWTSGTQTIITILEKGLHHELGLSLSFQMRYVELL